MTVLCMMFTSFAGVCESSRKSNHRRSTVLKAASRTTGRSQRLVLNASVINYRPMKRTQMEIETSEILSSLLNPGMFIHISNVITDGFVVFRFANS